MSVEMIERARAAICRLRGEATGHTQAATALGAQMNDRAQRIDAMTRAARDLSARLEQLRADLAGEEAAQEAAHTERDRHLRDGDAAARVADYCERTTLPDLAELLEPVVVEMPPPTVPDPSARIVPGPVSLDLLTGGHPVVTLTDRDQGERTGAQHARETGRLEQVGLAKRHPDEQQENDRG